MLIGLYGLAMVFNMVHLSMWENLLMGVDLIISLSILFYMNERMKKEPIMHQSPKNYYSFVLLVTLTIFLDGTYHSRFFPVLFVLQLSILKLIFPEKVVLVLSY